jgi:hypothetical protein
MAQLNLKSTNVTTLKTQTKSRRQKSTKLKHEGSMYCYLSLPFLLIYHSCCSISYVSIVEIHEQAQS